MIQLRRLNGQAFILNDELIETIEATPDTVVTLTNGRKYVVSESPPDIVELVQAFRRRIFLVGGGAP